VEAGAAPFVVPAAGEQGAESAGLDERHESELPESAEMEAFLKMAWPEATMAGSRRD
jgi:hypothetical protein